MNPLLTTAGLLFIAAITPGPNNLVVLRAAGHAGMRGAMPAIAGVVLGGLVLLAISALGAGAVFTACPPLRQGVAVAGSLYLAWLGVALCRAAVAPTHAATAPVALPAGVSGLIGFQFLNPKSWVIVLASLPVTGLREGLSLLALFVLIPALCLGCWAAMGAWLGRALARPAVRRAVDAAMGALLLACALLLPLEP